MRKNTKYAARTVLFCLLAVALQLLRRVPGFDARVGLFVVSTIVIGVLINMTLYGAVSATGLLGGLIVSLVSLAFALWQGPVPDWRFALVLFGANAAQLLIFWLMLRQNRAAALLISATAKYVILYSLVSFGLFPKLLPASLRTASVRFVYGWPQLVFALAGGALAVLFGRLLKKAI
ncbi:hypothetical protein [Feifania hominis]|uniref:Uncharacterized protein n=1 Tax=Feifania hominis TaxID=2763660 RepID=A0A926HV93_9FIRM|nr:hypothetical protein [Feifania hominis]MBC8536376.1 hypothetical protein [Feifania hominis]